MLLQDSESARTPQPPKGEEGLQGEKSSHITPKGSQPQIKQTGSSQTSTEKKPSSSGFCLSADAPPYTPQSSAAKQETKATNSLGAVAETFDLGFIRPFNSPLGHQQQHNLQQKHGYASLTAPLTTSGDARVPRRAESVGLTQAEAQLQSDTTRKLSLKPSANAVTSTVPLKFCKFLVGEDVAGFLVGRKGVVYDLCGEISGIEEFQSRNGPGLKGCFKLVVPETALVYIFTPDPEGRVPVLEVAKKHGVEILSSAEGGYLHNKIHHLGLKETILQIIGTSDTVPPAVVDLSLLYQGDPSLPSSLHLNYSHAHFVATPPPPPTPPPSPALSSNCGTRFPPHFAHPSEALHLTSSHQSYGISSTWSQTPQPTPILDGHRVSVSSQASMLCMPSTVGSSDSMPSAQVSQVECQLAPQKQGYQGSSSYALPSNGSGCLGGWQNCQESPAVSMPSLAGERLTAELQHHLGAAIVAAAAANAVTAQQQSTSVPTNTHTSFWPQQQQQQQQEHPQQQLQQQLRPSCDWPQIHLLSQFCAAHPKQISRQNEQNRALLQDNAQRGQFHQVESQQPILQRQIQQAQQEHRSLHYSNQLDEVNGSRMPSSACAMSLQQLQEQINALQLQCKEDEQRDDNAASVSSFTSSGGQPGEQKQVLLAKQTQQQLQQYLQQQMQQRQPQNLHQSQLYRQTLQVDIPPLQRWTLPNTASLHDEQNYPITCSEPGDGQLQQLQQLQSLRERTLFKQDQADEAAAHQLKLDPLQHPPHEAPIEPLSPVPPPQWAQIPQHQLQQQAQQLAQSPNDARMPLSASQSSPSGAPPDMSLQLPQRQLEAHDGINVGILPQHPKEASSALKQAGLEGPEYPAPQQLIQSEDICDPLTVRKLLEDLLKIIGLSTIQAPNSHCQGSKAAALTHSAETTLDNEALEEPQQRTLEVGSRTPEGVAMSSIHTNKVYCI
ncbi:hypothetical protein, conserved [Eimeria maxima]|uniref:Uncharacterized protein n=1 Tax=Eimeria maxima TaxID=5804 RepID=U6MC93_EIMMA|nr:hypothetical protein, conserved [Eimeria maxima]CDJ60054.1 hypothetical protein, conserved [Eimeria maxima]